MERTPRHSQRYTHGLSFYTHPEDSDAFNLLIDEGYVPDLVTLSNALENNNVELAMYILNNYP